MALHWTLDADIQMPENGIVQTVITFHRDGKQHVGSGAAFPGMLYVSAHKKKVYRLGAAGKNPPEQQYFYTSPLSRNPLAHPVMFKGRPHERSIKRKGMSLWHRKSDWQDLRATKKFCKIRQYLGIANLAMEVEILKTSDSAERQPDYDHIVLMETHPRFLILLGVTESSNTPIP